MPHRDEKTPVDLVVNFFRILPVWVGPTVAVITYCAVRWLLPWWLAEAERGAVPPEEIATRSFKRMLIKQSNSIANFSGLFLLAMWAFARGEKRFGYSGD